MAGQRPPLPLRRLMTLIDAESSDHAPKITQKVATAELIAS